MCAGVWGTPRLVLAGRGRGGAAGVRAAPDDGVAWLGRGKRDFQMTVICRRSAAALPRMKGHELCGGGARTLCRARRARERSKKKLRRAAPIYRDGGGAPPGEARRLSRGSSLKGERGRRGETARPPAGTVGSEQAAPPTRHQTQTRGPAPALLPRAVLPTHPPTRAGQ